MIAGTFAKSNGRTFANVYFHFFLTGDIELIAKLEEEIKHEKASGVEDAREQQASIDYTLKNGEWQAKDVEGEQEVVLTKKFGNETYVLASLSFFLKIITHISCSVSASPSPSLTSTTCPRIRWTI